MATYPLNLPPGQARYNTKLVWEWPIRIFHWVLAASLVTLLVTGLYISHPIFTSTGEAFDHFQMGRFRQIHFVAGYVFLFSLTVRVYWYFTGNKYARSGTPLFWRAEWRRAVIGQIKEYLWLSKPHVPLGHNSLAGLSYFVFVGLLGFAEIATGFALYGETNPGGFWDTTFGWVIPLLGGSFRTHMWHHLLAWGFVIFVILHVYIVFYDDAVLYRNGLISSMITGKKFYKEGDLDHDERVS
jgi:Ni/Fe-hydrogenase 1 B-type cytochrome subunit